MLPEWKLETSEKTQNCPTPNKVEIKNLSVFYGKFRAVTEINMEIQKTRSRPSSAPPAAANPPCCAPSTA